MTVAREALATARTAAAIARSDPSDSNRQAARAAIGAVTQRLRADQVGVSASGHGYNPYRDKGGRFGAGAHKVRPTHAERQATAVAKAQERVGKAKASVDKHADKLSAATAAKHAAIAETRGALQKASAAAELARQKPTAKNVKAAQVATNKATRAAAKIGKHEGAIAKHTEAHAKATTAHAKAVEAHAAAHAKAQGGKSAGGHELPHTPMPDPHKVAEAVASDQRRALVGRDLEPASQTGQAWTADGKLASSANILYKDQFSPTAQAAAREHTDHLISQYGLHNKDAGLVEAHTLHVRTDDGMAGADGAHWGHNGQIAVHAAITADIQDHALLDAKGLRDLGARHLRGDQGATEMLSAHRVLVHEAVHGHGPDMIRTSPRVLVEELTTEMAARKISADVHGLRTSDMSGAGTYHNYIDPAVGKLSVLSGRGSGEAHEALARASIAFKRGSERQVSPTDALRQVGSHALRELGVTSKAAHDAMYDHMIGVSNAGS